MNELIDTRDVRYAMAHREMLSIEQGRWRATMAQAQVNVELLGRSIRAQDELVEHYIEQEAEHGRRHQSIANELGMEVKAVHLIVRRYRDRVRKQAGPAPERVTGQGGSRERLLEEEAP